MIIDAGPVASAAQIDRILVMNSSGEDVLTATPAQVASAIGTGPGSGGFPWGVDATGYRLLAPSCFPAMWPITTGLNSIVIGTGAAIAPVGGITDGLFRGGLQQTTGTTATGQASYYLGITTTSGHFRPGTARMVNQARSKLSAQPDATNTYLVYLGFFTAGSTMVALPSASVSFVGFRIDFSGGVVRVQAVTSSTTTITTTDVLATLPAFNASSAFFDWKVEINAAGDSVSFLLNGSLVATHTTNIPTVGLGSYMGISKSVGTTPVTLQHVQAQPLLY